MRLECSFLSLDVLDFEQCGKTDQIYVFCDNLGCFMLAQRVVFGVAIVVMIGVLGNQSLEQLGLVLPILCFYMVLLCCNC